MLTLYLHIGMMKTGSTAFQRFAWRHRRALWQAGLAYPELPLPNHSSILEALFLSDAALRARRLSGRGHQALLEDRGRLRQRFDAELAVAARAGRHVLLSGEAAAGMPPHDVASLARAVRRTHERVVVLALVRPPLAFTTSMSQQRLKRGALLEDLFAVPPLPRYRASLEPYLSVFGAHDVRLKPFRDEALLDGCVAQTLLAMSDLDRAPLAHLRSERVNETLRLTGAKLLASINRSIAQGRFDEQLPEVIVKALGQGHCGAALSRALTARRGPLPPSLLALAMGLPGPPFALPLTVRKSVRESSAEDERWMWQVLGEDLSDHLAAPPSQEVEPSAFTEFTAEEIALIVEAIGALNVAAEARRREDPQASRAAKLRAYLDEA